MEKREMPLTMKQGEMSWQNVEHLERVLAEVQKDALQLAEKPLLAEEQKHVDN